MDTNTNKPIVFELRKKLSNTSRELELTLQINEQLEKIRLTSIKLRQILYRKLFDAEILDDRERKQLDKSEDDATQQLQSLESRYNMLKVIHQNACVLQVKRINLNIDSVNDSECDDSTVIDESENEFDSECDKSKDSQHNTTIRESIINILRKNSKKSVDFNDDDSKSAKIACNRCKSNALCSHRDYKTSDTRSDARKSSPKISSEGMGSVEDDLVNSFKFIDKQWMHRLAKWYSKRERKRKIPERFDAEVRSKKKIASDMDGSIDLSSISVSSEHNSSNSSNFSLSSTECSRVSSSQSSHSSKCE